MKDRLHLPPVVARIARGVDGLAVEEELAAGRLLETQQHLGEHGLAAARLPDQRDDVAIFDLEGDVVDRGDQLLAVPEGAAQVPCFELEVSLGIVAPHFAVLHDAKHLLGRLAIRPHAGATLGEAAPEIGKARLGGAPSMATGFLPL